MKFRQILLSLLVVDFLAVTSWAVYEHGFVGFITTVLATPAGIAVFTDLCLALTVAAGWTWYDARRRGGTGWHWFGLTALLGSAAPMLYLVGRLGEERGSERESASTRPGAVAA